MSDPNEAPEQAAPDTPSTPEQEIDWRQRYESLRPDYDRNNQELAALRKLANGEDPDQFQAVLDKYGYELDDPTPEPDLYDEPAPQADDPRIAQFEQFMHEQQQAQEQQIRQAEWDGWQQFVKDKAKASGVDLTDRDVKSFQLDSVGANGLPVPQAEAEQILNAFLEEHNQRLEQYVAQQRKRPRAPHVPSGGQPGGGEKDTADMTRSEKVAFMVDRLNAESA